MESSSIIKTFVGVVSSNKMDKSCVVVIRRKVKHPVYSKYIIRTKKFMAHDEKNETGIGDLVEIKETRPISKNKCWRVTRIIEKAKLAV